MKRYLRFSSTDSLKAVYRVYDLYDDGGEDDCFKSTSSLKSAIKAAEKETAENGWPCHVVICPSKNDLSREEAEMFESQYGFEPFEVVWTNFE